MDQRRKMKIGILGAGHIGKTLARKLAAAGHEVKVALAMHFTGLSAKDAKRRLKQATLRNLIGS